MSKNNETTKVPQIKDYRSTREIKAAKYPDLLPPEEVPGYLLEVHNITRTKSTLDSDRSRGVGLPWCKVFGRVVYKRKSIDTAIDTQTVIENLKKNGGLERD